MAESDAHQFKDRYMLRLPDGMRDRIKAAAEANNRSMNAEIVATLEKTYPPPKPDIFDEMGEEIARIAATLAFEEGIDASDQEAMKLLIRRAWDIWNTTKGPLPINEAAPSLGKVTISIGPEKG